MDKYEYNLKIDQIKTLCAEENYESAVEIADTINWNKVKNVNALVRAGEAYEKVERYEESRDILLMAYDRSPIGRMIIFRLAEVAIKMKDFPAAQDYYEEFVQIAPHDNLKYVLRYEIKKEQGADIKELIPILEELKEQEYTEEWSYELAYLYHKAGMSEKCIDACDELILWFGDGPYVERALELKMLYQPLTKAQEEKYRKFRFARDGITQVGAGEVLRSGEYIHDTVEIPQVSVSAERYNTVNLQEEIAKGMKQIIGATKKEMVSDTMDNIKKIVEDIPYLQLPREDEPKAAGKEKEPHIETDEEINSSLKNNFQELLGEESDGQIRLMVDEKAQLERQITGQLTIADVLEGWEKTKRAAEAVLQEAEQRKLESAKARALQEAEDIMDRLNDVIPKLDAGISPKKLLEEEYLQAEPYAEEPAAVEPDLFSEAVQPAEAESDLFSEAVQPAEAESDLFSEAAQPAEVEADLFSEAVQPAAAEADLFSEAVQPVEAEADLFSEEVQPVEAEAESDLFSENIQPAAAEEDLFSEDNQPTEAEPDLFSEDNQPVEEEPVSSRTTFRPMENVVSEETADLEKALEEESGSFPKREISPLQKEPEQSPRFSDTKKLLGREILRMSQTTRMDFTPEDLDLPERWEEPKVTHHLTPEQKAVFSYFVPVKGMEDQLGRTLEQVSQHLADDKTAGTGNIIIQGGQGCGKTVLATSVIKALQKETGFPKGKVGKIDASALNKKDIQTLLKKVAGGCLIIERAGELSRETEVTLSLLLEHDESGILIILEDTSKGIKKALSLNDSFARMFTEKISVPIFTNDDLVAFAKSYSNELGYEIDEVAVLALYNRISSIQRLDQATTLTEVKEIVDEAIEREARGGIKKAFSILTAKRYTEDDRILLREKDFE